MARPNRLKAQCALAGESIGEAADAVNIARSILYDVSRGAKEPWPKLRRDLADHFGVPESRLFPASRSTDRFVT